MGRESYCRWEIISNHTHLHSLNSAISTQGDSSLGIAQRIKCLLCKHYLELESSYTVNARLAGTSNSSTGWRCVQGNLRGSLVTSVAKNGWAPGSVIKMEQHISMSTSGFFARVRVCVCAHTQCKHITHTGKLPIFGFDKVGNEGHERMGMSDFAHFFVGSVDYVDVCSWL